MKKVVWFIGFMMMGWGANAQFQISKLTVGGGLGLQFGDYTVVNIAPQVGYDFTHYLNAGAGLTYSYYKEKHQLVKQANSYLGMNLYARLYPLPYIVLLVQPEINRMWETLKEARTGVSVKNDKLVPTFLVGGGVRLGAMTLMLQYDLARNTYSPYGNRLVYSVGYTFGF
jgi:hypothetical protein